jgi:hypothetical protein
VEREEPVNPYLGCPMNPEFQALCLQFITDEWRKLRPIERRDEPPFQPPWGVWIRLYEPISLKRNVVRDPEDRVLKVWFLNRRGLEERDPWEYARFVVANWDRPWASIPPCPPVAIWGYMHEIAMAAFADYPEEDRIYLEYQWGRVWGRGYRMKVNELGALEIEETLWRS